MRPYDAVLLDAFGTLIELDRPFQRLRLAVEARSAVRIGEQLAERAFRREMAHYAEHCHLGRDRPSLRQLRLDCAGVLLDALGLEATPQCGLEALAEAIVFRPFDDVALALAGITAAGLPVAVVSNWDYSLPRVLERAGLRLDPVFTSASTGSAKPDPGIFLAALAALGVEPSRALHVGDTPATDGIGARNAGVDVRIVDRSRGAAGGDTIGALTEIVPLLR